MGEASSIYQQHTEETRLPKRRESKVANSRTFRPHTRLVCRPSCNKRKEQRKKRRCGVHFTPSFSRAPVDREYAKLDAISRACRDKKQVIKDITSRPASCTYALRSLLGEDFGMKRRSECNRRSSLVVIRNQKAGRKETQMRKQLNNDQKQSESDIKRMPNDGRSSPM